MHACVVCWLLDMLVSVSVVIVIILSVSLTSLQTLLLSTMNKMKNFKRRFSLSVPRTETIEENEFTEQINQLNIRHTQGRLPILRLIQLWRTCSKNLPKGPCQSPDAQKVLQTLIPDRKYGKDNLHHQCFWSLNMKRCTGQVQSLRCGCS